MMKYAYIIAIGLPLISLPACDHTQQVGGDPWMPPQIEPIGELPDYDQLVTRYNENLQGIDQIWSRADVTVEYKDDKGKKRKDRGDQSILMIKQSEDDIDSVALALGGLGKTVLWIGCDAERYWVFHLQDEKSLHYGAWENINALTTKRLPAPIYPNDLPLIMGIEPLVPSTEEPALSYGTPIVEWSRGYYLIETPWNRTRILIDPETAMPVRIDRFGNDGLSNLIVRLSEYEPVEFKGIPSEISPRRVSSRIEAWVLRDGPHVTIKLRDISDGRVNRKQEAAMRTAFNLEVLLKAHNPRIVVDLDQP